MFLIFYIWIHIDDMHWMGHENFSDNLSCQLNSGGRVD